MPLPDELPPRFWDDEETGPPADDAALRAAEETLGVRLPAELQQLLRVQDGGLVADELCAFPPPEPPSPYARDCVWIERLDGVRDRDGSGSILESPRLSETWGLPAAQVLLAGDGHWWVALDYRECGPNGEPRVVFWDTDEERCSVLAATFRDFVDGLGPMSAFVDEPELPEDRPPPRIIRGHEGSTAMKLKVDLLRDQVTRHASGTRSLANTRAWIVFAVEEVVRLLPRSSTEPLRQAVQGTQEGEPEGLAEGIEAVIRELERLLPAWLETKQHAGNFFDQQFLDEVRARGT